MYGPPVRPPQPSLGLAAAFGGSLDWKTSEGEDRYRRALYTEWRRTNPYASMATFDAPTREVCALRRPRSNTPLAGPGDLERPGLSRSGAGAWAVAWPGGTGTAADRAALGFRLCLARPPSAKELNRLVEFYQTALADYATEPEQAKALAGDRPRIRPPQSRGRRELAAWTAVGNVLLNLDEMLMKP